MYMLVNTIDVIFIYWFLFTFPYIFLYSCLLTRDVVWWGLQKRNFTTELFKIGIVCSFDDDLMIFFNEVEKCILKLFENVTAITAVKGSAKHAEVK